MTLALYFMVGSTDGVIDSESAQHRAGNLQNLVGNVSYTSIMLYIILCFGDLSVRSLHLKNCLPWKLPKVNMNPPKQGEFVQTN